MDRGKLNDSEKEIVLVANNAEAIYPLYLNACHACANAAIKNALTEEKAIRHFLPVVRLAIEYECGDGVKYYDVLPIARRKMVAAYLYTSEKDEIISEMTNHTVTYMQKYIFAYFRHIKAPGV